MRKRWVAAGAILLAALAAGLLLFRPWSATERPSSTAARREAPPVAGPAGPATGKPADAAATPGASPAPPAGSRVEFATPQATPAGQEAQPRATPDTRQRRAASTVPGADQRPGRSGRASPSRVQVKVTAPQLADYFQAVSGEIAGRWRLPKSAAPRSATIPVVLKVARDGRVLWALVEGSSGEAAIDASVARMIEDIKQTGLPPLPGDYPYDELDIGLVLNPAGAG